MVFNSTTDKLGLIQDCEMALFGDTGYGKISGDSNRLLQFTARINRRQDEFARLALTADGTWQWDDSNDTDFPTATTSIVSGQRDYTFDVSMLEIEKVMVLPSSTSTGYVTIYPVDIQDSAEGDVNLISENNSLNAGSPYRYDKTANSVILDPIPNYSVAAGIKIIFKRGPNYFVSTDTTGKSPGFASIFHNYLSRGASLDYAIDRIMPVANNLATQVAKIESQIIMFFNKRRADERNVMRPKKINYI